MIRPRWMKVVRDLWTNKSRTVLVVASIAIGIFAVVTIAGSQAILQRELDRSYQATRPAHATLGMSLFDDEFVAQVRRMEGIGAAEGARSLSLRAKVGSDAFKNFSLIIIPPSGSASIHEVFLEPGARVPRRGEVLVERSAMEFLGAKVGEPLLVETADRKVRELMVVGAAHDLQQMPTFLSGHGYVYATLETLELLGFPVGYARLHIRLESDHPTPAEIRQVANQVKRRAESAGLTASAPYLPGQEHPADQMVQVLMLVLGFLGVISLVASGFLVINTIGAILAQNRRQIGILKAIGAKTGQIVGLYLGLILCFALLSVALGLPLGALGAWLFSSFLAGLINFDILDGSLPSAVLLLAGLIGLVLPVLTSLPPIISTARVTVREAISDQGAGAGQGRRGLVDRLLERVRILSRPLLLSLRNTFRRKGRLAMTLITLTLAGTIFIGVFSVRASLILTTDHAIQYWNYDFGINLRAFYRTDSLAQIAKQVEGVVAVESWAYLGATRMRPDGSTGSSLQIVAPPAGSTMINPILVEGRWLLPEDQHALVINTEVLQRESDIRVGDILTLKSGQEEFTWHVVGKVRGILTGPAAYTNYEYLSRLTNRPDRASNIQVMTERSDAAFQTQAANAVKERLEAAGMKVGYIETMTDVREQVMKQFNILVLFLTLMALLLASVGGLGLAGTMSINVLERTREIGVMRAIGASTGAMLQIFLVEGLLITLISVLIATLLSLPLSRLLSDAIGQAFIQAPLSYTFSVGGVLLWFATASLIAVLSCFLPSWRATRLTVRDVLAYE